MPVTLEYTSSNTLVTMGTQTLLELGSAEITFVSEIFMGATPLKLVPLIGHGEVAKEAKRILKGLNILKT
jgi:hypothetical protein